jgi:phosphoribosylformylglycinamidine (FGAM) synthase-like enzyme
VAAAEMALAGGLGLSLDLNRIPVAVEVEHPAVMLFSESNGRWLVEVAPEAASVFEETMDGCPVARCGQVLAAPLLRLGPIEIAVRDLEAAWQSQV